MKKKKSLFDSNKAKEQMEKSNELKSADNLIGSLMVGTLLGSIASIAIWLIYIIIIMVLITFNQAED